MGSIEKIDPLFGASKKGNGSNDSQMWLESGRSCGQLQGVVCPEHPGVYQKRRPCSTTNADPNLGDLFIEWVLRNGSRVPTMPLEDWFKWAPFQPASRPAVYTSTAWFSRAPREFLRASAFGSMFKLIPGEKGNTCELNSQKLTSKNQLRRNRMAGSHLFNSVAFCSPAKSE